MAKDRDKLERLKSLLNYGIDHNEEHQDEIEEWAELARDLSYKEAGKILSDASDKLGEVTEHLSDALERLNEGGE